jgi:uncharacterized protein YbbC (DUF1343 family)
MNQKCKYLLVQIIVVSFDVCLVAAPYKLGVEALPKALVQRLLGKNIGLVTNQTGVDHQGRRTVDILRQHGLTVAKLLAPEHGIDGATAAGKAVEDTIDKKTGIPVQSLYQEGAGKKIGRAQLHGIDVIIFDLQDSGMRHYTYISTLMTVLEAAALYGKEIIVLDRPNPLGSIMEGPLVESSLKSFVSIAAIPVRHGMTMGELATYFNERILRKRAKLTVVWMDHYDRRDGIVGSLLAKLSPNLPSLQACYGYSFLGLLGEVSPFEIGIKVGKPFQTIMVPESSHLSIAQWQRLSGIFRGYGIDTCGTRCTLKKCREQYRGLWLTFKNINSIPSFQIFLEILDFAREIKMDLVFSNLFDKAVGTKKVKAYMQGNLDRSKLIVMINSDITAFARQAQPYFHYKPVPRVMLLH